MKCPKCGSWAAMDPAGAYWCQDQTPWTGCNYVWFPDPRDYSVTKQDDRKPS